MPRKKIVLIASSVLDEPVWAPVAEILKQRGLNVVEYRSDKVSSGNDEFLYKIQADGSPYIEYAGQIINPRHIDAAWYRRPIHFEPMVKDKALQLELSRSRRTLQGALWRLIPKERWLNAPQCIQEADFKPLQLIVAADLGFKIPETIITNQWRYIKDLPKDKIYKPVAPVMFMNDKEYATYTTRFRHDSDLPVYGLPFPGYWQPYIPKKREWRITVVGDKVFEACIITKRNAKDDWRRHQDVGDLVKFVKGDFPAEAKKKCLQYLKKFNLRFGAFDFIETPKGELVFLECNPNGQYGWLEDELGFPITEAIADELIAIATRNK